MKRDYRVILQEELTQRKKRNPSYSLRSFAKALGISPSNLSAVLKKKKGLSRKSAMTIAELLNLRDEERTEFVSLVELQHSRSPDQRIQALNALQKMSENNKYRRLKPAELEIVSNWHYVALLHYLEIPGVDSSPIVAAHRLGISLPDLKVAFKALSKLGLIEKDGERWVLNKVNLSTPNIPSSAIRKYHHQILRKASESLETQSIEERDFSSVIMTIDSSKIAEAKEWLQEFRRNFCRDIEKSKNKDAVYCLSLQFFNLLTKPQENI